MPRPRAGRPRCGATRPASGRRRRLRLPWCRPPRRTGRCAPLGSSRRPLHRPTRTTRCGAAAWLQTRAGRYVDFPIVGILLGLAPWIVYWVLVGNVPFSVAVLTALAVAVAAFVFGRVRGGPGRTLETGALA